jgi:competence ComEA-like helix-hairpin-helix protein
MSLTTSWTEGDAVREWRQGVRKLLLLLYAATLLTSLGCFLWNASVPVRVHSAPKCYPSKGDEFSLAPVPTLPADSILNTGDAAALDALPGIGTVLSERIITYREEHGAFVYPEDLRNVQGIGAELQTKITDSLDDESTNPLIAPAAETTTVPRATLPPDSILNTGDAAALDALPGIGPVLSERIVTYREEHGAFVYLEELRNVKGIGEKRLQAILDALAGESAEESD